MFIKKIIQKESMQMFENHVTEIRQMCNLPQLKLQFSTQKTKNKQNKNNKHKTIS